MSRNIPDQVGCVVKVDIRNGAEPESILSLLTKLHIFLLRVDLESKEEKDDCRGEGPESQKGGRQCQESWILPRTQDLREG